MTGQKGSGIVFSSEYGRMCPTCDQPMAGCRCGKEALTPPRGDGVVRLRLETKGRKGKAVTTLSGLPFSPSELELLTKELKRRCGSGGTVKEFNVEIQGDHRDTVERAMQERGIKVLRSGG